jgi:hypothetical protein
MQKILRNNAELSRNVSHDSYKCRTFHELICFGTRCQFRQKIRELRSQVVYKNYYNIPVPSTGTRKSEKNRVRQFSRKNQKIFAKIFRLPTCPKTRGKSSAYQRQGGKIRTPRCRHSKFFAEFSALTPNGQLFRNSNHHDHLPITNSSSWKNSTIL